MGRTRCILGAALLLAAFALGATWAVDPQDPGPNLPPEGRSLFDVLTIAQEGGARVQRVPVPFSALLTEIEERLGRRPDEPSPLKRVLIPLGRSLQRNAAAPEFFRYPRAIVAVDTEASGAGLFLKDRLFLGYHEKAQILEVISYNEAAGRFEFQIVRDYRPGGAAQVVYANRAVCTACHQGGSPLFPRQLWDETNANPEIARLLAAEGRDFYGLPVRQGVDVPFAIDAATDRANRLAVDQLLWREGCGGGESESAVRCRAAAFTAALQSRLSGRQPEGPALETFLSTARQAWELLWPQGLAIPDPDIPNRNPLASHPEPARTASLPSTLRPEESKRLDRLVRSSHVPAVFEPLSPRPPLEVWTADGAGDQGPSRLITGLAGFLPQDDVRQLDAALFTRGSRPGAPRERRTSPCEVEVQPRGATGERVKLRCQDLEGRVYLEGGQVSGGTIERLEAPGGVLRDLDVVSGTVSTAGGRRELAIELAQKLTGLHVRRADGQAVETVELSWQGDSGEAAVVFLTDFDPAAAALQDLATRTLAGDLDAFSSHPFRRSAVLIPLFADLGLEPPCCLHDEKGMPPPLLESEGTAGPADFPEPAIRAFYQYCGRCHASPEPSPPNFLYGDVPTVRTNLAHCAERIFYRLDLWRLPAGDRPKTPMPPVHALARLGLSADTWPADPALVLLRQHAAELLRAGGGSAPRLEERGYESLQSCLERGTRTSTD